MTVAAELCDIICPTDENARIIDLPDRSICIPEFSGLQDECGAVIWDAALVLANYLIEQAKRGGKTTHHISQASLWPYLWVCLIYCRVEGPANSCVISS